MGVRKRWAGDCMGIYEAGSSARPDLSGQKLGGRGFEPLAAPLISYA